ncbi:class Ib ribonucleoside-diphosphate reductase assembly flavoprotein NrdI [Helcobacillus massiliensis]|uniref:Protein NrdI n=1 Tax=Helcobacillus massiliensis TaxID=521392 RepID=A0A839R369_9MICO|nr:MULTISPECIES: class Ib ribonucleoside-diphosphate reductase assembly flavoprotein NrdI [Helcobacillus]MBB3023866.1 protein involved in ribonucleotide reduction [Helcobacillus massiliensis]MCG7427283.1 class Ib ribonucleoside-diphosphate reductase assembly flavoprotein NrdI [Helcobacillus sp. ACRRO]MCT1556532.1 class Ib ribonucleoside-diphosphate reductase assembly flavoprotein NrdI [Helcobacillus massiliensis]MCT2035726.1 class Ib ribonucleoside-diphosphate reductase assembly flavoprotein Nr
MGSLVYFSSVSGNTKRFVDKLDYSEDSVHRIPLRRTEDPLVMEDEFVLVVPTYGGGTVKGAVPKQVITFLNDKRNRTLIRGVITGGNTNFGEAYCKAGDIISAKCQVPHMYRFELFGTPQDVDQVKQGLERFWHN